MKENITLENVEYGDIYNRPDLITFLLYKKLLQKLADAERQIREKDFFQANRSIQFAQDVIVRLGAGLKYEAGSIADQIEWQYQYWVDRLREANLKKDIGAILEVKKLSEDISHAWTIAMDKENKGTSRRPSATDKKFIPLNPYQRQAIEKELLEQEQEPDRFRQQK